MDSRRSVKLETNDGGLSLEVPLDDPLFAALLQGYIETGCQEKVVKLEGAVSDVFQRQWENRLAHNEYIAYVAERCCYTHCDERTWLLPSAARSIEQYPTVRPKTPFDNKSVRKRWHTEFNPSSNLSITHRLAALASGESFNLVRESALFLQHIASSMFEPKELIETATTFAQSSGKSSSELSQLASLTSGGTKTENDAWINFLLSDEQNRGACAKKFIESKNERGSSNAPDSMSMVTSLFNNLDLLVPDHLLTARVRKTFSSFLIPEAIAKNACVQLNKDDPDLVWYCYEDSSPAMIPRVVYLHEVYELYRMLNVNSWELLTLAMDSKHLTLEERTNHILSVAKALPLMRLKFREPCILTMLFDTQSKHAVSDFLVACLYICILNNQAVVGSEEIKELDWSLFPWEEFGVLSASQSDVLYVVTNFLQTEDGDLPEPEESDLKEVKYDRKAVSRFIDMMTKGIPCESKFYLFVPVFGGKDWLFGGWYYLYDKIFEYLHQHPDSSDIGHFGLAPILYYRPVEPLNARAGIGVVYWVHHVVFLFIPWCINNALSLQRSEPRHVGYLELTVLGDHHFPEVVSLFAKCLGHKALRRVENLLGHHNENKRAKLFINSIQEYFATNPVESEIRRMPCYDDVKFE